MCAGPDPVQAAQALVLQPRSQRYLMEPAEGTANCQALTDVGLKWMRALDLRHQHSGFALYLQNRCAIATDQRRRYRQSLPRQCGGQLDNKGNVRMALRFGDGEHILIDAAI